MLKIIASTVKEIEYLFEDAFTDKPDLTKIEEKHYNYAMPDAAIIAHRSGPQHVRETVYEIAHQSGVPKWITPKESLGGQSNFHAIRTFHWRWFELEVDGKLGGRAL